MKIKHVNSNPCEKCLQRSLPVNMMIRFARLVDPSYNIFKRTGLKEGMPISNQNAAQRIVEDMIEDDHYVDFVETLVRIDAEGYMGRKYPLRLLDDVVEGIVKEGYNFDRVSGQFFENERERISPNWGRLLEGDERNMTVLQLDIAGNSMLVKNNSYAKIEKAYDDLRAIVNRAVISRMGRVWYREGDGTLAAFLFGDRERLAVFAGMEILHELFFYNRIRNHLASPLKVRVGVHIGPVVFSHNELERLKNGTITQAKALEAMALGNSLSVSYNLYMNMDSDILDLFGSEKTGPGGKYRLYSMGVEQ